MEQVLLEEDQEEVEVWVEVADEVGWAATARAQALKEFVYALIASCPYSIKWVSHAIV